MSFRRGRATKILVLVSFVGIFGGVVPTEVRAAGDGFSRTGRILAGLVAGSMIGVLTAASFAVVGNVRLDIVTQQQS